MAQNKWTIGVITTLAFSALTAIVWSVNRNNEVDERDKAFAAQIAAIRSSRYSAKDAEIDKLKMELALCRAGIEVEIHK